MSLKIKMDCGNSFLVACDSNGLVIILPCIIWWPDIAQFGHVNVKSYFCTFGFPLFSTRVVLSGFLPAVQYSSFHFNLIYALSLFRMLKFASL